MTKNEGKYCHVDTSGVDFVDLGPQLLPANWGNASNINNSDVWTDPMLAGIDWLPYVLIDTGAPDPDKKYNRSLSDFVINPTDVTQTAIYTEWSQEQYDLNAPVSPIDWTLIPAEQRQFVNTPYESVDRLIVGRIFQTWNTPDDIYALRATLYTQQDAEGMTVKVHQDDGTYLYTMELVETAPESGVWFAETHSSAWGQHLARKAWKYTVFKGVDLTPLMRLPLAAEESVHDLKWNANIQGITNRQNGKDKAPGQNK